MSLDISLAGDDVRPKTIILASLVLYYTMLGRLDEARSIGQDALAIAHAGGAYHFFAFHPAVLHRNLARAQAQAIEPEFVAVMMDRWPELSKQATAPVTAAAGRATRLAPVSGSARALPGPPDQG